ncbi:YnfU family zinc-binding protein [Erwinia amylovora]|uniref:YnfU family zinc-binding protein n=2 Tax=Erwinia amylovora TaxID=552 RepID=UPI0030D8B974
MRSNNMSLLNLALAKIGKTTNDARCPVCDKTSKQSTIKISKKQTLICPQCKSLFVIHS